MTVKFNICSRSAAGRLLRGVDGALDLPNLGEQYEKIEKVFEKKKNDK